MTILHEVRICADEATTMEGSPVSCGMEIGVAGKVCAGHSLPWFKVDLNNLTSDDIEVRICADEATAMEGSPVELVEIYI